MQQPEQSNVYYRETAGTDQNIGFNDIHMVGIMVIGSSVLAKSLVNFSQVNFDTVHSFSLMYPYYQTFSLTPPLVHLQTIPLTETSSTLIWPKIQKYRITWLAGGGGL